MELNFNKNMIDLNKYLSNNISTILTNLSKYNKCLTKSKDEYTNSYYHIVGQYANCDAYFCKNQKLEKPNLVIPEEVTTQIWKKINLIQHCNTLFNIFTTYFKFLITHSGYYN